MRSSATRKIEPGYASEIAISALQFLAEEPERLERFLNLSGLGPHNLRRAAADPMFLGSVLDHLAADESLLIAFAESQKFAPDIVMKAREALVGPTFDGS